MRDEDKTSEQLLVELHDLRAQLRKQEDDEAQFTREVVARLLFDLRTHITYVTAYAELVAHALEHDLPRDTLTSFLRRQKIAAEQLKQFVIHDVPHDYLDTLIRVQRVTQSDKGQTNNDESDPGDGVE